MLTSWKPFQPLCIRIIQLLIFKKPRLGSSNVRREIHTHRTHSTAHTHTHARTHTTDDKYGNLIAQRDRFGGFGGYGGSGYGTEYGHSFKSHTVAVDDTKSKARRPLVVIAGPPAGGKGTLCKKIAKKYNFVHLSTGAMLRERAKTDKSLAERMASGGLVSDVRSILNPFHIFMSQNCSLVK